MAQDRFLENYKNVKGLEFEGNPFILRTKKINLTCPDDASETGSDWSLPDQAVVYDVFLRVITAESKGTGKTLDVGIDSDDSGDADGYLVGVDVSSTGLIKSTLENGSVTLGALFKTDTDGSSDYAKEADVESGGKEITYTASNADWEEFEGNLYIVYAVL